MRPQVIELFRGNPGFLGHTNGSLGKVLVSHINPIGPPEDFITCRVPSPPLGGSSAPFVCAPRRTVFFSVRKWYNNLAKPEKERLIEVEQKHHHQKILDLA